MEYDGGKVEDVQIMAESRMAILKKSVNIRANNFVVNL